MIAMVVYQLHGYIKHLLLENFISLLLKITIAIENYVLTNLDCGCVVLEFKGHVVVRDASSCADQAPTALRALFPRAAWGAGQCNW